MKGGQTTRSTSSTSPIEACSSSANATASARVVFIFQLPATIGRRLDGTLRLPAGECGYTREHAPFDELQRGPATGRHVAHPSGQSSRLHCSHQVTAAHHPCRAP